MELKKYKLGELGKVITGKTPKTNKKENFDNGEIPFYTPEDIAKGIGMTGKNDRFITEIGLSEIKNNSLEDESVLVGCIGSDMGNVAYTNHRCAMNQQINAITSFKDYICPLYVYYYLSTKKPEFRKIAGATTTPILPKSVFCDYIILLPKYHIQRKIASVLYNIDRKIELNRAINQNLEAMAKQLYDYWFVQFDFPNEDGKPYKSSGGAMVWNEKLKREIPQGWSTLPISAILDKYPTTKRYETKEYLSQGKYPIIDQGDTYIVGYTNEDDNLLTRHPAVLFGDHSTKVKFLDFDFARGADGTQILYSSNDAVSQYYLYLAVSTLQIPNPGYSRHFKYLKELPIVIPSLSIAIKFANIVKPLFKKWTNNIFNNIALTKQRNELLPLLMNGQATVNYHLSDD